MIKNPEIRRGGPVGKAPCRDRMSTERVLGRLAVVAREQKQEQVRSVLGYAAIEAGRNVASRGRASAQAAERRRER